MKKTSNMFDAKRQNKYSIRKFTIGTASIIVGAALLFGLGEEARAAEVTSQTSNQSNDSLTDQPGTTPDQSATDVQTTDTETSQVETQTNTAAQTETQPIETSKETAPATAPETAEQPAPTEDVTQPKTEQTETTDVKEPAPEQQPASKHQSATQEAPAEQPTSVKEETAAKTEDTTVKTPTAQETAQTAPAKEEVVASEQNNATAPAENNTTEVAPQQEQQLKAADNTTVEGTQGTPSSVSQSDVPVNQEDLSAALQNSSNEKDNNTVLATQGSQTFARRSTFAAPSTFESLAAVNEQSLKEQLEKEAVYSPGVWNQKYGYQGYAVVMREGSKYNNTSSQKPIPNVPVYLQWTDSKGYVSPVYYTKSGQDGRYVFDLSKPQTDALGQEHTFNLAADAGIGIRTWAESPDNTLDVVKHGDGIRGFHKRLERVNESWDFTAGINRIVNSQVLLREKALANDWLTKPEEQWETSGTSDGIWKNTGIYGKVSGSIWHDLTDPYGSDARWIKKDPSDVNATGVKVIASYVNDEVAIKFDEWKKANPNATVEDFRNAQESIVTQYQAENGEGSHIAESVVGTVDKNGDYYIPFRGLYGISPYQQNSGTSISKTISDEEYGTLVKDADISHNNLMAWNGTVGQKHRHINSDYMYIAPLVNNIPTFGNNYHNNMFTSADVSRDLGDAKMLSSYNGSSQDFAFVSTNPMHKVSVENSTTDVAKPGDVLVNKTEGLFTGQEYQIQWFKDGVAIGDPVTVTADADGTVTSVPTTVSPDLESTAIYTSGVFSQGVSTASTSNALALDYILAEPFTKAELNEPAYQAETGLPGSTVDVKSPTFTDQNGADVAVPEGTTFKLGENGPEGVTINSDGSLVVAVPQDAVPGSVITVPVTVSYNDGSTDTVNAEVTVQAPQSDLNNPTYQGGEGTPGTTVDLASPTFTDQTGTPVTPPDGTTYAAGTNAPAGVTVNPDGSLSVAIADTEEPGTTISVPVDVTYPDGSVDTVNVPVTVVPQAPVVLPTEAGIDPIAGTPYPVTGTGYPGGTVDVTLPDGTVQQTTVNPDGTWTINPTAPLEAGQVVSATQTVGVDYNGQPNVSTAGTGTVVDTTAPDAPVVSPVTDADTAVSGTGEPNGTVTVTFPDGATAETPVDAEGNWTVNVPEGTDLKAGDEIKATEKDKAGNVSVPGTTVVTDETAPDAPVVSPVTDADTAVSGTGEPNGTVTVTFPDGTTVEAPVDAGGNWTVDVPAGTDLKAGDEIKATEKDEAGNV
ncbi:YPDG domain-containing protein, partial [Staphylococcus sp. EZ-P03]|uniref:YPDG domain-containing protein n=1 Tax=Staphylococcus sp. EZ-P03 TaxID=2282739 RepID=UPI000DF80DB8